MEREIKLREEMNRVGIPNPERGSFVRFANKWGTFGNHNKLLWIEYGPIEWHRKSSMSMDEMYQKYINRK